MSFISFLQANPAVDPAAGATGSFRMLIPLVLVVIIMYFFMIRPQNKKQKETEKMLNALKKGDKVISIGGIHGVVADVKENVVTVKVDDNAKIKFNRTAIATVVTDKPAEDPKAVKAEKKGLFGRKNDKKEKINSDAELSTAKESGAEKDVE